MVVLVIAVLVIAAVDAWRRRARWWAGALLASAIPTAAAYLGFVVALAVLLTYGAVSRMRPVSVS